MNFGQIARLLAGFMLFFSLFLMVPLGVALYEETDYETSLAFTIALATGLIYVFAQRGGDR